MLTTYIASCHCGAVEIEADLDLEQSTYRCNCTICRRTRFWPAVAREDGMRIIKGEDQLTRYTFNTHKNEHYFCRHCGVRLFGVGTETTIGKMYGVNVGCINSLGDKELAALTITYVDGLHDKFAPPEFLQHL
ncbi:MAG TPA: GFA family protein [Cellvibrio sp.]|nr:GFA family protein [Cellvibrio sp.]